MNVVGQVHDGRAGRQCERFGHVGGLAGRFGVNEDYFQQAIKRGGELFKTGTGYGRNFNEFQQTFAQLF